MAYDTLIKEAEDLSEDNMQEVIDFILFLKAKSTDKKVKKKKEIHILNQEASKKIE
jgi:hypothetical protein